MFLKFCIKNIVIRLKYKVHFVYDKPTIYQPQGKCARFKHLQTQTFKNKEAVQVNVTQ